MTDAAIERLKARLINMADSHARDGEIATANTLRDAYAEIVAQAGRVKALEGALTPFVGEHECDGHATVERFDMAVAVSVRWSDVIQGRAALNTGGQ